MNDDASQRDEQFQRLHRSPREQSTSDFGAAAAVPGHAHPSGEESTLDQLYTDAITALNRIVATLDFEPLPRVTEVLRATAAALHETDPARAGVLNNLGSAAQLAYMHSGHLEDLEDAVWYYRAATTTAREDDPDLVLYLCNLTLALTDHASKTHDATRAEEAVHSARNAIEHTSRRDPRRGTVLVRLGFALKLHARLADEPASDDESIDVFKEAVRNGNRGGAEPSELLISLGSALLRRYERTSVAEDLDEGISHLSTGVGQMTDGDPRRSALCHLANALRLRFRQDGDLNDLHAALNELLGVLGVLAPGHPLIGRALWSLACTTVEHTDSTGEPSQLRRVLRSVSPAVQAMADGDKERAMALAGYGALMRRHFLHGAETNALDTAVAAGQAAADCAAVVERRCAALNSLATTLITRFEHTGEVADLDRAAEVAEQAAHITPDGTTPQHAAWAQLGIIGSHRFRHTGQVAELETATWMFDRALRSMPEDAPERAAVSTHLGRTLQTLHARTGRKKLYRWARRVLTEAAAQTTAPADQRLRAASLCGRLAAQAHRWSEALDSFSIAIEMLPLVTRGKRVIASPTTQQRWALITADAAACALESGQPERAVELLEHGRGAILADFLPIGGELGGLHRQQPHLADQTVRLRRLLDRPPEEPSLTDLDISADGQRRRQLADFWQRLLAEVRAEPGHENHLRPVPFSELCTAGDDGAVALVNLSRYRSDALVIFAGRVVVVRLPGASPESATEQAARALSADVQRDPQALADALDWLWHNVTRPVLERIGYARAARGDLWPRMWWSTLGALTFLPLHAAASKTGDCVLDRVISSYTPTLRTLINARQRGETDGRALVAAGQLEQMRHSLPPQNQVLARYWPNAEIATMEDTGPDDMLRQLSEHSWVHICEPSTQDPARPAAGLVLDRSPAERSLELIDLGQVVLDHAEFGCLGYCTTVADTPSEAALPLATALGFSGFAHAIGTLWEIDEDTSAWVHAEVYATLSDGDAFDSDNAGWALHAAARERRAEHPDRPNAWSGFVHIGP
jgi:hypothetical protein